MSYVRCLRGIHSGHEYPPDDLMNLDPLDQRPLEMVLDCQRLRKEMPDFQWYRPEYKNLWRFGALLALDCNAADEQQWICSLGEGYTPELGFSDWPLAQAGGYQLSVKDEGRHWSGYGANPTLSFKDRGMVMTVSMAKRFGLEKLAVPTQGNAGDSLVEYALAAGLGAAVIMPTDTPMPIMGKVAAYACRHAGFSIDFVSGTIREAAALMHEKYLPQGYFNVATFQEPGWRIEGKKTLGLEIAEARAGSHQWDVPNAIIYPTGGGTGVLGMWKAFHELQQLGLLGSKRPRIYCVQSEATAPLVKAFVSGAQDTQAAPAGSTCAYGLNVPGGIGHFRVLQIIRESGGRALSVSEQQIRRTLQAVWQQKQWWLCPEGAACIAALEPLMEQGELKAGESVVVINTGSAEKYLPELRRHLCC